MVWKACQSRGLGHVNDRGIGAVEQLLPVEPGQPEPGAVHREVKAPLGQRRGQDRLQGESGGGGAVGSARDIPTTRGTEPRPEQQPGDGPVDGGQGGKGASGRSHVAENLTLASPWQAAR